MRREGSKLVEVGKAVSLVRGKGSKLGEPCPKVRLSQDRLPIEPFSNVKSWVLEKGSKLGEVEGTKLGDPCPKVKSGYVANRAISPPEKLV